MAMAASGLYDRRMVEEAKASEAVSAVSVRRITWLGLGVNLGLAALKLAAGLLGSSQAVVADAVHSLSDMSTDVAVLLGVKFWANPPDEKHPYGHGRIETLVTTLIGLALAAVAVGIGYHALATVREPHVSPPGWIAAAGALVSIAVKEWLYRWTVAVGRRVRSTAVIANAWHHRSDAISSIPALLAVAVASIFPDLAFIDHIGALIVSLFILKVAWDITMPALSDLIDRGVSRADRQRICDVAAGVAGVEAVHALRTRKVGSGLYVDLHVLVDGGMTVRQGHAISELVKDTLLRSDADIMDVVVHLEPDDDDDATT